MAIKNGNQGHRSSKKPHGFSDKSAFFANMPQRHIINAGRLLGMLVYFLDRRHRRIVRRNLRFAYPEWSKIDIKRLSKRIFQNMGITFLEICQSTWLSRYDILNKVRIRGKENLLKAVHSKRGIIIISAHLGNWEISPVIVSSLLQSPIVSVARRIQPGALNRFILRSRTRFGNMIIDKDRALPKMARMLRQGKILGILIDQATTRSEGVEVSFFGKTVTATPAAALLARRYNCPVLTGFCVREPDGRLTLIIGKALSLQATKDSRADLIENTQIMTHAVEEAVRAYPDQWLWLHKRWKRHYPNLYPEDMAKRKRRREKRRSKLLRRS